MVSVLVWRRQADVRYWLLVAKKVVGSYQYLTKSVISSNIETNVWQI